MSSGRIQGLYELSLTKHPLYQGTVLGHVGEGAHVQAGIHGPEAAGSRCDRHQCPRQPLSRACSSPDKVLGPIDPAQPAIYSFLIGRGRGSARFHPETFAIVLRPGGLRSQTVQAGQLAPSRRSMRSSKPRPPSLCPRAVYR